MNKEESIALLESIANDAVLENGEIGKDLLYEAFFERLKRLKEEE